MNKNIKKAIVVALIALGVTVGTGVIVLADSGRGGGSISFSLPKSEK